MQLNVSGHHLEITDALRQQITQKFSKLERFHAVSSANVVLSVEKLQHIIEATLRVNQAEIYAKASADNMYGAIDLLNDKLLKQLDKHKQKLN
ncbi:MAG: ribosome hibernation-promoting factor, HPF/YfiA family [Vibrionaceae bacterium]